MLVTTVLITILTWLALIAYAVTIESFRTALTIHFQYLRVVWRNKWMRD